jgi:hypothetical protein
MPPFSRVIGLRAVQTARCSTAAKALRSSLQRTRGRHAGPRGSRWTALCSGITHCRRPAPAAAAAERAAAAHHRRRRGRPPAVCAVFARRRRRPGLQDALPVRPAGNRRRRQCARERRGAGRALFRRHRAAARGREHDSEGRCDALLRADSGAAPCRPAALQRSPRNADPSTCARLCCVCTIVAATVVKINAYVTDREDCAAYMQARDDFIATAVDDDDELDLELDDLEDEAPVTWRYPASTLLVVSGFSKPGEPSPPALRPFRQLSCLSPAPSGRSSS